MPAQAPERRPDANQANDSASVPIRATAPATAPEPRLAAAEPLAVSRRPRTAAESVPRYRNSTVMGIGYTPLRP